ncbi:MAG: putative inorganic carbon transporter subunit DabA, partial [Pseudomonadota bacterium]
ALYFERLLMGVSGFAGHARYLDWEAGHRGEDGSATFAMLAIVLGWEEALLSVDARIKTAWDAALSTAGSGPASDPVATVLHDAFERATQRMMVQKIGPTATSSPPAPTVQMAFCIDVRSEVFRRALESVDPHVETIGFAGFFGVPIEAVTIDGEDSGARCPVLLKPAATVEDGHGATAPGASAAAKAEKVGERLKSRLLGRIWGYYKSAAVASFGFVEALGLTFGGRLVEAQFRRSSGRSSNLDAASPSLTVEHSHGKRLGIDPETKLQMAAGILRGMSLTTSFAPIVVLAGHGSHTVNNPYGSALECGACGGHKGDLNARTAAAILNDSAVRAGLPALGIALPQETVFVAALHDTTTDEVALFDTDAAKSQHPKAMDNLARSLSEAGRRARQERARHLGIGAPESVDSDITRRSRDWSEVRPEWGLAGCAAFVRRPA